MFSESFILIKRKLTKLCEFERRNRSESR